MKKLYIIGAGGFGREVAWLVERINEIKKEWEIVGFIDDDENLWKKNVGSYSVVGGCDYFKCINDEFWVVCAIGNARGRKKVIENVEQYSNVKFATLIDPSVMKSKSVCIGEGSIICARTIMTVDVAIGRHVIVNLDCTIGHDAKVNDYVTIYPSVNISGKVGIEECVEVGTSTQIIQGINIGKNTIIGAGATVIRDLPSGCTAVGCPAKPIKFREG